MASGVAGDRNAVPKAERLWPEGIIPYVMDAGLSSTVRLEMVMRAMWRYGNKTCIRFVPRTTETNYVRIFPGQGSLLDVPDMKINNDQLFDEVVLAKEYLQSNWEQWKQEETTRNVIISSEEKWLRLFGHFKENHIVALNLIKIVKYAFCLPGTSAPV
ncbi:hypothetical protein AVEN_145190-1 [Araneus ventricosus]|uniref:Peptidase M12A domain-containing protein n=1 Tax=Araneus ventricosus TaxID=182803 RepID=A0A4Y2Q5I4_ARAVE|nr:hypothetical protein AVEN_145190-1 [Araneus ventricosus]